MSIESISAQEPVLIVLSGYTKCRKSTISRLFAEFWSCESMEMSDVFRSSVPIDRRPTLNELLAAMDAYRAQHGAVALARVAIRRLQASRAPVFVLAGVRNADDFGFLKLQVARLVTIYIHASTELRHRRLDEDPTSVAKGKTDYERLDRLAHDEGIRQIADAADFVIVSESGYPLTVLEQVRAICDKLHLRLGIPYRDTVKEILMTEMGVTVRTLPTFQDEAPVDQPISRVLKTKGELATLSIDELRFLAYVEFPEDGEPRANHFHEEKIEYLYLAKGRVQISYRRGGQPADPIQQVVVEAGQLVSIQPGIAHAYVTLESGFGVEFSPTPWSTVSKDKVRDYVLRKELA